MEQHLLCPICAAGELMQTGGRLDQSGESYLPTVVWACNTCGYARYEPALHAAWQPVHAQEPDADVPAPTRRAA